MFTRTERHLEKTQLRTRQGKPENPGARLLAPQRVTARGSRRLLTSASAPAALTTPRGRCSACALMLRRALSIGAHSGVSVRNSVATGFARGLRQPAWVPSPAQPTSHERRARGRALPGLRRLYGGVTAGPSSRRSRLGRAEGGVWHV